MRCITNYCMVMTNEKDVDGGQQWWIRGGKGKEGDEVLGGWIKLNSYQ